MDVRVEAMAAFLGACRLLGAVFLAPAVLKRAVPSRVLLLAAVVLGMATAEPSPYLRPGGVVHLLTEGVFEFVAGMAGMFVLMWWFETVRWAVSMLASMTGLGGADGLAEPVGGAICGPFERGAVLLGLAFVAGVPGAFSCFLLDWNGNLPCGAVSGIFRRGGGAALLLSGGRMVLSMVLDATMPFFFFCVLSDLAMVQLWENTPLTPDSGLRRLVMLSLLLLCLSMPSVWSWSPWDWSGVFGIHP